ncbi:hypothetical protein PVK06_016834 [Gossypium arboreum]|uniref:Uncharacterized protein n=1 Tax=Gossypium arboreum TaxID=29729 RepID=A0ABR0Q1J7_GOSAR|nr:hypothetical protein PVK06_016834 [Gossypium arboreum]
MRVSILSTFLVVVLVTVWNPALIKRHKRSRCSRRLWPRPTVTENLVDADGPKRYGPWMLIKRNPSEGKKHQQQEFRDGAYFRDSNKFEILMEENNQEIEAL